MKNVAVRMSMRCVVSDYEMYLLTALSAQINFGSLMRTSTYEKIKLC